MTGSQPNRPYTPTQPDPSPSPVMMEETQAAKSKVGKKKRGRGGNILAGRMMAGRKQILDTQFNTKLGES